MSVMAGWLSLLDWWHSVQCVTGSEEATTYFDEDMEEVRWITFLMQRMVNTVFQCYSFVKFYILDVMIFIRKTTLSQVQNVYWCLYFSIDRIILELCCMLENSYVWHREDILLNSCFTFCPIMAVLIQKCTINMSVWVGKVQLMAFFGVCDATKFQGCTVANTIVSVPSHPWINVLVLWNLKLLFFIK
jgi:hypothetical protein